MGAIKAGVSLVTFEEKDSIDALETALKDSGARGMLFSPTTDIEEEKGANRQTYLERLMPELSKLYPGDVL